MSVLVNAETKVICQGFTGAQGTFHTHTHYCFGLIGRTKIIFSIDQVSGNTRSIAILLIYPLHGYRRLVIAILNHGFFLQNQRIIPNAFQSLQLIQLFLRHPHEFGLLRDPPQISIKRRIK